MGVLDQLRQEADQKKSAEQRVDNQDEYKEQSYKTQILPKMQQVFKYMQELVAHLNYLDVPIQIENYSDRFPKLGTLKQQDYKINTDGYGGFSDLDKLMQINVTFYCAAPGEFQYRVQTKAAIEYENAFLHSKRIPSKMLSAGAAGREDSARFVVARKIPVRVRFEVDYEGSRIKVMINNHTNFSSYSEFWRIENINADFLDTLARYLLRKDNDFVKLDMTDAYREDLRHKLSEIQKNEEQEFVLRAQELAQQEEREEQAKIGNKMKAFIASKIGR